MAKLKYIAYFQANTNTYGPLKKSKLVSSHLSIKKCGCNQHRNSARLLGNRCFKYLDSVNKRCDLWVELGLQTIHDKTAKLINRGHSYLEFIDGLNKLRQLNINVCVHIINGLPFETHEMMLTTAKEIGKLDIQALKIHMLYVIKNTKLNQMYQNNQFTMLTRDEYIDLVTEQLSYLPENIVIERLTGDGNVDDLVAPDWSIKKVTILNDIDKLMVKKNYVQGCNLVQK
ncbi:MAG: TIGR01212 family radical SAM protein [Thomasclavelia ramosa]